MCCNFSLRLIRMCLSSQSFGDLPHRPLLVDLTVEEGQRLKVIYGSSAGFHAIDVDSGNNYDIYIPVHVSYAVMWCTFFTRWHGSDQWFVDQLENKEESLMDTCREMSLFWCLFLSFILSYFLRICQIQSQVIPHAIVFLPNSDGMEMLLCYEDEGVYVNTYGRIIKDVVLQWGEMPTSVGECAHTQTYSSLCKIAKMGKGLSEWKHISCFKYTNDPTEDCVAVYFSCCRWTLETVLMKWMIKYSYVSLFVLRI